MTKTRRRWTVHVQLNHHRGRCVPVCYHYDQREAWHCAGRRMIKRNYYGKYVSIAWVENR